MKLLRIAFVFFLFSTIFVVSSFADATYQGTINWLGGEPIGNSAGYYETTTSVDLIYFTVNTAGTITIDLLSTEVDEAYENNSDINGDGEIAYIDPYIHLFYDDGNLDSSDWIAENDDSPETYNDGSINGKDSFLSISLSSGTYILAVGDYYLDMADAVGGTNYVSYGPFTSLNFWGEEIIAGNGDYQVSFTGDVSFIDDCPGDFDNDGDQDGSDLAVFAEDFGRTNCDIAPPCEGDFDTDDDVDGSDLATFAADFGRTNCP